MLVDSNITKFFLILFIVILCGCSSPSDGIQERELSIDVSDSSQEYGFTISDYYEIHVSLNDELVVLKKVPSQTLTTSIKVPLNKKLIIEISAYSIDGTKVAYGRWVSELVDFNTLEKVEVSLESCVSPPLKYTVSYYVDETVYHENLITEHQCAEPPVSPDKEGYVFLGWFEKDSEVEYSFDSSVESDMALYARFSKQEKKYTVSYYVDETVYHEDLITEHQCAEPPVSPNKEGYVFLGWFEKDSEVEYSFDSPVESDMTLYARFSKQEKKYTVSYYVDETVYHEDLITEHQCAEPPVSPDKEGYVFLGWFEKDYEVEYSFDSPVESDMALYANYIKSTKTVSLPLHCEKTYINDGVQSSGGTVDFEYDSNGNLTKKTERDSDNLISDITEYFYDDNIQTSYVVYYYYRDGELRATTECEWVDFAHHLYNSIDKEKGEITHTHKTYDVEYDEKHRLIKYSMLDEYSSTKSQYTYISEYNDPYFEEAQTFWSLYDEIKENYVYWYRYNREYDFENYIMYFDGNTFKYSPGWKKLLYSKTLNNYGFDETYYYPDKITTHSEMGPFSFISKSETDSILDILFNLVYSISKSTYENGEVHVSETVYNYQYLDIELPYYWEKTWLN